MTVLMVLIPLSLLMATAALAAFVWGVRSGQFDDLASPAAGMLPDDPTVRDTRSDDGND